MKIKPETIAAIFACWLSGFMILFFLGFIAVKAFKLI